MQMPGAVRLDADAKPKERHTMTYLLAVITVAIALMAISIFRPKPRDVSCLPPPSQSVRELIRSGRKIPAIRAYRRQTGASLLEASRVVGHSAA